MQLTWPTDCGHLGCWIEAYNGDTLLVRATTDSMSQGHFDAQFAYSNYGIEGFQDVSLPVTWKAKVFGYAPSLRPVGPDDMTLRIFHAFRADTIKYEVPPPDTLPVGDTLKVIANPFPSLKQNPRIRYAWKVAPSNAGHYRYGTGYPLVYRNNQFIADLAGDCQIFYVVIDTVNGYADTSAHKTVHVKPKLVIDKPRRDTTFWITPAPLMPQIKCQAHLLGVDTTLQRGLNFNWKIKLKYENYILERQGTHKGIGDWIPDFGTDFGGDTVFIDVGVKYGQDSLKAHIIAIDSVRVLGQNIQGARRPTVEAYIDGLTQYEAQARSSAKGAACYETPNYYQFHETGPNRGLPYREMGGGGGRGIMQLTYPTYVTRNSLWNWHENVRMGTQACHERYGRAVHDFTDSLPGYQPTDLQVTKQILAKYNGNFYTQYFKYYSESHDFARDTIYCADCGACGSRTGEHFKTIENQGSCDQDCDNHTPYCYSDGAYNCAH